MVAGEEHLAGQNAVDVGPVQRHGGRILAVHADAQDVADSTSGLALHRLQRELLHQNFQHCDKLVQ